MHAGQLRGDKGSVFGTRMILYLARLFYDLYHFFRVGNGLAELAQAS